MSLNRRAALGLMGAGLLQPPGPAFFTEPFGNGERPLIAYPQKRKLIRLTARPPQLETPIATFDPAPDHTSITANDAFFVRYHLADLPVDSIDPATYRLTIDGKVRRTLSLSLADLRKLGSQEIIAVCQCSGNGRGFFTPRVPGGQAGNGLMGNARWQGVPLRAVLDRAGVAPGAVEVSFDGLDEPVTQATPDFVKSLPIDHARDGEVMLAWAMNGADLPFLNGYPLRLVVPGYFATYWVKHLSRITVLDRPLDNFWMSTAYRVPDNSCACVPPGAAAGKTRPIGQYAVRSLITNIAPGSVLRANPHQPVRGIAFDSGSGIAKVEISADGGTQWQQAHLGPDLGRYSFRAWHGTLPLTRGHSTLIARATARSGAQQPMTAAWNPGGYLRNVVEAVDVTIH